MKILRGIFVVILILLVGFYAIGFFVPQIEIETSVEVNQPVEKSFAVFMDEKYMQDWLMNLKSVETVSGEPNTVGSKYRLTFLEEGREISVTEEVTAYRKNEEFAFHMEHESLNSDVRVLFSPSPAGTQITMLNETRGNDWFMRSMLPLMQSHMSERQERNFNQLKLLIEGMEE